MGPYMLGRIVMKRLVRSSRQPSLESLMPANASYDRHLERFVGDDAAPSPTAKFTVGDHCMAQYVHEPKLELMLTNIFTVGDDCMAQYEHSLCGADGRDTGGGGQVDSGHIEPGAVQEQLCCEDHGRCVPCVGLEEGDADDKHADARCAAPNLTVLCIGMAGGGEQVGGGC
jgi:hypothetical protein